jgi:DNA-binding XRE family transcriptional regulator
MNRGSPDSPARKIFRCRGDFCRRLKNLRIFLGMTQNQFARQLGVDNHLVSKWERVSGNQWPGKSNWSKILQLEEMNYGTGTPASCSQEALQPAHRP